VLLAKGAFALIPAVIVLEGPITNPANNHQYEIIGAGPGGTTMNWTTAEADAQLLGGNLVTINDAAENAWVVSNLLVNNPGGTNFSDIPLWIGLSDPTFDAGGGSHADNFVWADGDPSTYRNWNTATGEPNNASPGEFYAAINWHFAQSSGNTMGTWNDTPLNGSSGFGGNTDGPYFGIVEIAPEPASAGVLCVGAMVLLRRRR
jgi:hypothetical protein